MLNAIINISGRTKPQFFGIFPTAHINDCFEQTSIWAVSGSHRSTAHINGTHSLRAFLIVTIFQNDFRQEKIGKGYFARVSLFEIHEFFNVCYHFLLIRLKIELIWPYKTWSNFCLKFHKFFYLFQVPDHEISYLRSTSRTSTCFNLIITTSGGFSCQIYNSLDIFT